MSSTNEIKEDRSDKPDLGRRKVDRITTEEIEQTILDTAEALIQKLRCNPDNNNLCQGLIKLWSAQKYPISRLSSALHYFGVQTTTNMKVTATPCLKRAKRGKIHVKNKTP